MSRVKIISNKQGQCPYCGSVDINYGSIQIEEDHIYYPAECNDCYKYFEEWHYLKFIGHNVGCYGQYDADEYLNEEIDYD